MRRSGSIAVYWQGSVPAIQPEGHPLVVEAEPLPPPDRTRVCRGDLEIAVALIHYYLLELETL